MENFVADGIYIDSPPDVVFASLLRPKDVLVWMDAEEATIEATQNGRFFVRRFDGSTVTGTITGLTPNQRLEISDYYWEKSDEKHGPMRLSVTLQPRGEGVWITLRQDGLDSGTNWKAFAQETRKELVRSTVAMKRHIDQI